MANTQKDVQPLCEADILRTSRVLLVKNLVLENVLPSVKPFLMYSQVDEINGGKTRGDQIRKLLDILQLLVSAGQYQAFNAFMSAMAGTQPDLFKVVTGRLPTVAESDFCMKEVVQEMKTTIDSSKHCTDSELDEQIDFRYEYVELSMVEEAAAGLRVGSQEENLPHEYSRHLQKVHSRNRNISACDVLDSKNVTYKKVLIYGRAGIGKSTTMQFLAKQWALGRWAAGFTFLFLLQLRFLTTQVIAMSTVELLRLYGLYDFPIHTDSTPFTSWLKNYASRILILIDGLDEIPGFAERMKNTPRIHDVFQKAHLVDLCINILRGDLLPGCTVISASRPFAGLSQLHADAKAEILGLTSAKVTEYVEHRHPHHVKNIMSVLQKKPILLSVCSITFYGMLITRLLSEGVAILDEDIKTYTRLMSFIIIQYCSRKINDSSFQMEVSSYFHKLAQLAYSGIYHLVDNEGLAKIVFDEDDLIKSNISPQDLDNMKKTGMLQVTRKKIGRHESWTAEFFHLSAQELLAVAHFLSHPPFPNRTLSQLFHGGQFNLALQFIFGLHFDRNHSWIRKVCSAVSPQFESEGIEPELSSFIDSILEQKFKVCQLIHEGQWEEKAKEVVSHIAPGGKLMVSNTTMTAIDLLAVDYICQMEALSGISMHHINADETFVDLLLSTLCEHHSETLQELDLWNSSIGAAGAAAIAESLYKGNHKSMRNEPRLKKLLISSNKVGDEGAKALGGMLVNNDNLQELDVTHNEIEEEGLKGLANGLTYNTGLKVLKLNGSYTAGVGAEALGEMLHHNTCLEVLNLERSGLDDYGVKVLADGLKRNNTLTELTLHHNVIGDKGAAAIAKMLYHNTRLQTLDISHNQLGYEGVQAIADSLVYNTSLRVLEISAQTSKNMRLGDAAAVAMADMLHKNASLVKLNMSGNNIGDAGAVAITDMLHKNTGLVELNISENRIDDAGVIAIAHAFWSSEDVQTDLPQTQDLIHVVTESTKENVEVRRGAWCGCLAYLCRGDAEVDLTQYNTTEGAGVDLTQYNTTEGAGVDLTQYNTTLRTLRIWKNRIGPDGEKALNDITKYNVHLKLMLYKPIR